MTIVPLGISRLEPADVLSESATLALCYYWIDDDGRLCLAMRGWGLGGSRFGRSSKEASLVLGPPAAGVGRNYRVDRETFRMIEHDPPKHERWASLSGIVALWRIDDTHVAGRFRIYAKYQRFHIAMGWYGNHRSVIVGEFQAVLDAARGGEILRDTEADGMERGEATHRPKATNAASSAGKGSTDAGADGTNRGE